MAMKTQTTFHEIASVPGYLKNTQKRTRKYYGKNAPQMQHYEHENRQRLMVEIIMCARAN